MGGKIIKTFFYIYITNMSDSEGEIEIKIKPVVEEEIFNKPVRKKRVLTDKQKEALANGRAKAKAKRDAIKAQEAEKVAMKKIKKEQKDIQKATAIEAKNKQTRKEKTTEQVGVREKIRKMEYDRKHKRYNAIKDEVLGKCESVAQYDTLTRILNGVNEEDIMDESKLKNKLHSYIQHSKKYYEYKLKK